MIISIIDTNENLWIQRRNKKAKISAMWDIKKFFLDYYVSDETLENPVREIGSINVRLFLLISILF